MQAQPHQQIDSVCTTACTSLIRDGYALKFVNESTSAPRTLTLGKYLFVAENLVPKTEAPIAEFQSPSGWRVVLSNFLHHDRQNLGEAETHVRFFNPKGGLMRTLQIGVRVNQTDIGNLFGGSDEVFAVTSEEEHAYNIETQIWLLPKHGDPKLLLAIPGAYRKFVNTTQLSTVEVERETYDGVHSGTKGKLTEFWVWDAKHKSLTR